MVGKGHIALFRSLLIGNLKFPGVRRVQSWPFVGKTLGNSNRQDLVFIRPPGIQEGGFELRLDNVWFCRVLLLFKIKTQTDSGLKELECTYVSVLEQYTGRRIPGMHILHTLIILHTLYILYIMHIFMLMHIIHTVHILHTVYIRKSTNLGRMDKGYQLGNDL